MNIETNRLTLSPLTPADAGFILELLNTPGWLKFIGNKNVHTIDEARNYIINIPMKSYNEFGFGLLKIKLKNENIPIGICGLIKRDTLEDVDIGFALLPEFEGKGFAFESVSSTLTYSKTNLGINRVVAITDKNNSGSTRLLHKLGFSFEKTVTFPGDEELKLFAINFDKD